MIFRCTGSLMRTSELLSLCVEQKFLLWWAPYWRTVGSGVRSPSVAVFQLDAADSYSRSVSICIPGQFISLLLFLSFLLISVYLVFLYLSGFFPLLPTISLPLFIFLRSICLFHTTDSSAELLHCWSLPSPFLSVHSLLEQTYEKSWQLSQRSFHKTAQSEW